MLILGIDPGTATVGYGLIKARKDDMSLVDFGWIKTEKEIAAEIRLDQIYKSKRTLLMRDGHHLGGGGPSKNRKNFYGRTISN